MFSDIRKMAAEEDSLAKYDLTKYEEVKPSIDHINFHDKVS